MRYWFTFTGQVSFTSTYVFLHSLGHFQPFPCAPYSEPRSRHCRACTHWSRRAARSQRDDAAGAQVVSDEVGTCLVPDAAGNFGTDPHRSAPGDRNCLDRPGAGVNPVLVGGAGILHTCLRNRLISSECMVAAHPDRSANAPDGSTRKSHHTPACIAHRDRSLFNCVHFALVLGISHGREFIAGD